MADNHSPLDVVITAEGALRITIGEETLAYAAYELLKKQAFEASEGESDQPELVIDDAAQWAKDVVNELLQEDEAGDTPLMRLLDKMFVAALNRGSLAVSEAPKT